MRIPCFTGDCGGVSERRSCNPLNTRTRHLETLLKVLDGLRRHSSRCCRPVLKSSFTSLERPEGEDTWPPCSCGAKNKPSSLIQTFLVDSWWLGVHLLLLKASISAPLVAGPVTDVLEHHMAVLKEDLSHAVPGSWIRIRKHACK